MSGCGFFTVSYYFLCLLLPLPYVCNLSKNGNLAINMGIKKLLHALWHKVTVSILILNKK